MAFGGTFNGNPISLAGAHATLAELSANDGALLKNANRIGGQLMEGIREVARKRSVPVLVTGFGAAFAIHFTARTELREYRDILDDDTGLLAQFPFAMLAEGVYALPDGRFYVSAVHGEQEVESTRGAIDRAFQRMR